MSTNHPLRARVAPPPYPGRILPPLNARSVVFRPRATLTRLPARSRHACAASAGERRRRAVGTGEESREGRPEGTPRTGHNGSVGARRRAGNTPVRWATLVRGRAGWRDDHVIRRASVARRSAALLSFIGYGRPLVTST